MKISYNWLKSYLPIDLPAEEVADILTQIGLEVEHFSQVESVEGGFRGIVIGEVLSKAQHPNADRLSVCQVSLGTETVQIVCGAPNVDAGQKVVVATVGTTLYPTNGESFKIKKSKIRGEESFGMICAEDEIGLGESHDGIMVLDASASAGTEAAEHFGIETDVIFDIGLTPNRSDGMSHFGVAQDLAAYLKYHKLSSNSAEGPNVSHFTLGTNSRPFEIEVKDFEACPRYAGITFSNVEVKESPNWLKQRLNAVGVRPINNIVDITNFVQHELGQPLHAFDADEVQGDKIIVRQLPQGTKFLALDELERELHEEDLMICDGNNTGMCIAGVFGGATSGVSQKTKNIFLESAHFDAMTIRKASMRHNLRTDAAIRYEKGTDPNLPVYALKRAALLFQELAGAEITSEIIDLYPTKIQRKEIEVRFARVSKLIGTEISAADQKAILEAMDMKILSSDETKMRVSVPTNKAEVLREVDIIEEILRIYGLNNVAIDSAIRSAISYSPKPDKHRLKNQISAFLSAQGGREAMSLSLSQSAFAETFNWQIESLVHINNTSNQSLDIMRPNMLVSALENLRHNLNYQNNDVCLYEFGRTYFPKENGHGETNHLTIAITGKSKPSNWHNPKEAESDYFHLKSLVEGVLSRLGIQGFQSAKTDGEAFLYGQRFFRGQQEFVQFGRVHPKLEKAFSVKQSVFYADFNWDMLMRAMKKQKINFAPISKYPSTRRDLALVIEKSLNFEDIVKLTRKEGKGLLKSVDLFDVYENEEQLGAGKKSYAISLFFQDDKKTLKDKDVDKVVDKLIQLFEKQLNAVIRK